MCLQRVFSFAESEVQSGEEAASVDECHQDRLQVERFVCIASPPREESVACVELFFLCFLVCERRDWWHNYCVAWTECGGGEGWGCCQSAEADAEGAAHAEYALQ